MYYTWTRTDRRSLPSLSERSDFKASQVGRCAMILCFLVRMQLVLNVCSSAASQVLFKHLFLESWINIITIANCRTGRTVGRQTLQFYADYGHRRIRNFAATDRFEELTCAFYRSHWFLATRPYKYGCFCLIKCVSISDHWRRYESLRWRSGNSHRFLLTTFYRCLLDFWSFGSDWCKVVLFIGSRKRIHGFPTW